MRQQISSAVDLIIQQTRLKDGARKVTAITEVVGMEGDTVVLTDVFKFEQISIGENNKILGDVSEPPASAHYSLRNSKQPASNSAVISSCLVVLLTQTNETKIRILCYNLWKDVNHPAGSTK
ncbi:MAG: hypothetical protein U0V48_10325 [Anaerolineales bacterium]